MTVPVGKYVMRSTTSGSAGQQIPASPPPQFHRAFLWLKRAVAILWWALFVALLGGILQYIGNHAGAILVPLLPQIMNWIYAQPTGTQIGLALLALGMLLLMSWMTVYAWNDRQQRTIEDKDETKRTFREILDEKLDAPNEGIASQQNNIRKITKEIHKDDEQDVVPRASVSQEMGASNYMTIGGGESNAQTIQREPGELQYSVIETRSGMHRVVRVEPLQLVRDLERSQFKMGDDQAESFPYLISPIRKSYDAARQVLVAVDAIPGRTPPDNWLENTIPRRGLVVIGEANAGKSRLIFEVLTETLPHWSALVWSDTNAKEDIPSKDVLRGRQVVVVLNDLHTYFSPLQSGRSFERKDLSQSSGSMRLSPALPVLKRLVETVIRHARQAVIVVTYRSECAGETEIVSLIEFLEQLVKVDTVEIPRIEDEGQVAEALRFFREHGAEHAEDEWDETLGSAVLGLKKKRSEYQNLVKQGHSAVTVLHAMKLLRFAGAPEYTERHIRRVCGDIFHDQALLNDGQTWTKSVSKLEALHFVRKVELDDGEIALSICADTYYEKVVDDYLDDELSPSQRSRHLIHLVDVFIALEDAPGLFFIVLQQHELDPSRTLLPALERVLKIYPDNAAAWASKGFVLLYDQQSGDRALECFDRALTLDPECGVAWIGKGHINVAHHQWEEALKCYNRAIPIHRKDQLAYYAYKRKGQILASLKRYPEALEAFTSALIINPKDAVTWRNKCHVYMALQQYYEARDAIEEALKYDPKNVLALCDKGSVWNSLGISSLALNYFNKALALDERCVDALAGKGVALFKLNRVSEAASALESALELDTSHASIWMDLGDAYNVLRKYEEALYCFEQAIWCSPASAVAWNGKGSALNGLKRYREALTCFDTAVTLDSEYLFAWHNMGAILLNLKNHKSYLEALGCYGRVLEIDPSKASAWANKGKVLNILERYAEALECYERALAIDPTYADVLAREAETLCAIMRPEEALAACDHALAINPACVAAWANRGNALYDLQRYEDALESCEKALAIDPSTKLAWHYKGAALSRLDCLEKALDAAEQMMALMPGLTEVWLNKAAKLRDLKRYAEALECYVGALKHEPNDAHIWYLKGVTHYERRQKEQYYQAVLAFQRSLALDHSNPTVWYYTGLAFKRLELYPNAVKDFDQALHLDPLFVEAWYAKWHMHLYFGQRDPRQKELARIAFDHILALEPKPVDAWMVKGYILNKLNKPEEAVLAYEEAVRCDPESALAWGIQGDMLFQRGRYDDALTSYTRVTELDPSDPDGWCDKARTLAEKACYVEALESIEQAIALDLKIPRYYHEKGEILLLMRRKEEAQEQFNIAIILDPGYEASRQ